MFSLVKTFAKDESGATAIEYGLIAAIVSVAIIAALNLVGDGLNGVFAAITTQLQASVAAQSN